MEKPWGFRRRYTFSFGGILTHTPYRKLCKEGTKAYASYKAQIQRCYNPRSPNYRWYGAKGIQVMYGPREFIAWWMKNTYRSSKTLVCDRIDSKGNYTFKNIQLITRSENALKLERKFRRVIWHTAPGGPRTFDSVPEACKATGLAETTIRGHCNGWQGYRLKEKRFSYASPK